MPYRNPSTTVPLEDQLAELRRELYMRGRVYPRLIERGKLKQGAADAYNARLKAAIATLEELLVERSPPLPL